jgi:cell division protein FtsL
MRILLALFALLLTASALSLVTAQHRARSLFIDLERAQQQARTLDAEGDRLRVELGRASQPAAVASAARQLGLKPVDAAQVVFLPSGVGDVPAAPTPQGAQ